MVLNSTISHFCESCLPFLSHSLIGEEYQEKVRLFCSRLSPNWNTSQIGFECSLSDQQNWGDFHCLANVEKIHENSEFEDPSWISMTNLFNEWFATGLLEKNSIGRVILEFDIGSSRIWPPKPNICLVFTPRTKPLEVIANILSPLRKRSTINNFLTTIKQFLTKGAYIRGIGLMLARSDCLRIVLGMHNNNADLLINLFNQINVKEIVGFLLKTVDPFRTLHSSLFEIDVNEDGIISPRIGIDIPPINDAFLMKSVLEKLYLRNWINSEKKNALLSWIGVQRQSDFISQPRSSIIRDIHHVKVVTSPHQDVSVKAYLSSRFTQSHESVIDELPIRGNA